MLCKTSVARKVLAFGWKRSLGLGDCHIFPIDAGRWFGASVEACLLVARFGGRGGEPSCLVHDELRAGSGGSRIGYRDGLMVADVAMYERRRELRGRSGYVWRSGVKHDCARVMELTERSGRLVNGPWGRGRDRGPVPVPDAEGVGGGGIETRRATGGCW